MRPTKVFLCLAGALAAALAIAPAGRAADKVLVFAAASTVDAVGAALDRYRAGDAAEIRVSFAATSALARQIEHGAPAAIFIAANAAWMDRLQKRGHIVAGTRRVLFSNRLALIAPRGSSLAIRIAPGFDLAGRLGPGERLAVADPDHVPAGIYARAALLALGAWPAIEARLARAADARAALALVARGEAAAGIVYRTDALASKAVRVLDIFPRGSHPPIAYPLAIVAGNDTPAARRLYRFLLSGAAARLFARHGFLTDPG